MAPKLTTGLNYKEAKMLADKAKLSEKEQARFDKLPTWAKEEFKTMHHVMREAQQELASFLEMRPKSNTAVVRFGAYRDNGGDLRLEPDASIRFTLPSGMEIVIRIDGASLYVNTPSSGQMVVMPEASNALRLLDAGRSPKLNGVSPRPSQVVMPDANKASVYQPGSGA